MWNWLRGLFGLTEPTPVATEEVAVEEPVLPRMRYAPAFNSGRSVERFRVGPYRCDLLTDIENLSGMLGVIRYAHVLVVADEEGICLFVVAEGNSMRGTFGGGSHFLCIYPGEGSVRLGDGDHYADLAQFRTAALDALKSHFQLPADTPVTPVDNEERPTTNDQR
jgi:hypothetical protein